MEGMLWLCRELRQQAADDGHFRAHHRYFVSDDLQGRWRSEFVLYVLPLSIPPRDVLLCLTDRGSDVRHFSNLLWLRESIIVAICVLRIQRLLTFHNAIEW
jgi:hypothetical protein